jgi:hypothetical protein
MSLNGETVRWFLGAVHWGAVSTQAMIFEPPEAA